MTKLPTLDPVIHAPARLRIMSALAALDPGDTLSFSRLQQLLDLTAGNLITHLRKLDEAGYVSMASNRDETSKATSLALTDRGRQEFRNYRAALQEWLSAGD